MKENNINNKKSPEQGTTPDPKVKASKPASDESAKSNAVPKDSKKGLKAPKKKHSYIVIGECLAGAAIVITCIGFASCSNPSPVEASATASPTASAKAVSLYDNAEDVTLLDSSGKETADKISVASVNKSDVNKSDLQDWYYNDVVKNGYKYGILKYTDDSGKGIYADSTGIYEGNLKEDTATKGYAKPADTSLIYTVDTSKKTLDSAKKSESSAAPKATAPADAAEAKEEKGDTAADNSSNTSSDSGNSGSTVSQGSKPAGGSSNSSSGSKTSTTSGSSSKSQTCRTVHHDATGHYENVTSQQWVQDTAAYDETVVDQAAYNDPGYYKCNYCGYTTSDINDIYDHCEQDMGTFSHIAGTYHPAVTHTVHHDATGHYETVVTGQQWVQDSAAYDETVCG